MQKPTIGRIVIYQGQLDTEKRAAIITKVNSATNVDLVTFGDNPIIDKETLVELGIGAFQWNWPVIENIPVVTLCNADIDSALTGLR